jgi:hypothetical protein
MSEQPTPTLFSTEGVKNNLKSWASVEIRVNKGLVLPVLMLVRIRLEDYCSGNEKRAAQKKQYSGLHFIL